MENKVQILKEMGHDITGIIEGCNNPKVLAIYYGYHKHQDIYIPAWTEEEITKFSNRIYEIVTKQENKTYGEKENVFNGRLRENQTNSQR